MAFKGVLATGVALMAIAGSSPAWATVSFEYLEDYAYSYTEASNPTGNSYAYNYYNYGYSSTSSLSTAVNNGLDGSSSESSTAYGYSIVNHHRTLTSSAAAAVVGADTYAYLNSASSGAVSFSSSTSAAVVNSPTGSAYAYSYGYYYYEFDTSGAAKLTVSWTNGDVSNAGDGYYIYTYGGDGYVPSGAQAGSQTFDIGPGSQYLEIYSQYPDYVSVNGPGSATGGADGNFNFSILSVPETSTWIMMILGFAGLAFAGYRGAAEIACRSPADELRGHNSLLKAPRREPGFF